MKFSLEELDLINKRKNLERQEKKSNLHTVDAMAIIGIGLEFMELSSLDNVRPSNRPVSSFGGAAWMKMAKVSKSGRVWE